MSNSPSIYSSVDKLNFNMAGKTMKALVKEKEGVSYKYMDYPVSGPDEGELLVRVTRTSICGSDLNLYSWNEVARTIAKVPFIPGHECVGEIIKVGAGCPDSFKIGQRVCCENHYFCGKCYQCLHGQENICQHLNQYGHGNGTVHGGCCQYTIIPARYAYVLRTDISDNAACLLEPFGVSHLAMEKLEPADESVLIQGCGPIGLMATGIAKAMGAKKIIVTDIVEQKLELAKKLGADILVNGKRQSLAEVVFRETDGYGVGRILEASGNADLLSNCFKLLRKGGVVVLVGLVKQAFHVEDFLKDILFKSLTIKTLHGRHIFSTWEKAEKMLHQR
ncbi:L-threonine 3-dehydrogenase, partial [Paramuricea clavata]